MAAWLNVLNINLNEFLSVSEAESRNLVTFFFKNYKFDRNLSKFVK